MVKEKSRVETEEYEKQARDDEKEIEELKDDLWQEKENNKDLLFQRESMYESNEREFRKLQVEIESKNSVIKSLNKKKN